MERKPRRRHATIITQLSKEHRDQLAAHAHPSATGPIAIPPQPPKPLPQPERFHAGPAASITIDGLGSIAISGDPFIGDMEQQDAARLIKTIARYADIHPDAVADFIDDITRIEPE